MSVTSEQARTIERDPDRVIIEAKKLAQRHGMHWSNELDREICVTLVLGSSSTPA